MKTESFHLRDVVKRIRVLKKKGQKIVLCHGVFDLLHVGHIRHFQEAKALGDVLVISISPDRFVRKGPHRPAFSEKLRAEVLAGLRVADFVVINEWPTAIETIKLLRPDFYVKGTDYNLKKLPEKDVLKELGIKAVFVGDKKNHSTKKIVQRIRKKKFG